MTDRKPVSNGHLTSGRLLAKNTLWNLTGFATPMLVAVFCIPVLIRELGKERFGVLTLAWAVIGYASLFDLGLGRALTQFVATKLGSGEEKEIPSLAWTSLLLMLLLGICGGTTIYLLSPKLVTQWLNIPASLRNETLQSFRLLALSVPFVITTSGLRGLLEAYQRFGIVNILRVPMGVLTFFAPMIVLPFSHSLIALVGSLIAVRVGVWLAHLGASLWALRALRSARAFRMCSIGPLLRFGGWMTISNIINPVLITADRFLIGALGSLAAVAYYATPYEAVTKFLYLPCAVMAVMFPAFSVSFVQDSQRTALLYRRSIKSLFLVSFPCMLCAVALAPNILTLWLGADFAQHSYRVFQILALGVFVNSLAQAPFYFLQGVGKPKLTATIHLIELPLYLSLLWWLIRAHGIEGAAIAFTTRVVFDALALFAMSRRYLPRGKRSNLNAALLPGVTVLVLVLAALIERPFVKAVFLLGTMLCFALVTWFRVLTPEERKLPLSYRP